MSQTRVFRASSVQQALNQIRRELGGQAVILDTRQVESRRRLPWLKSSTQFEVTVGVDQQVARSPVLQAISNDSNPGAVYSASADRSGTGTKQPEVRQDSETPTGHELWNRLDAMERMLEKFGQTHQVAGAEIPGELFHLYTDLIDAEVEDQLARELICRVKQEVLPHELRDGDRVRRRLQQMVEEQIHCGSPIVPVSGQRKIVGLIGPTGVGKTTTIAKLAANFRIRDGIRMGLVTVDTYRIAAVEQLRTYAEIIDLPMKVVTSPREMRRAIDELVGLDLILIDTAGRSPRDELKLQELRSLFAEAQVDEVHLVLSLTASARNLLHTAQRFMSAMPTSLILTKLDEAAGLGGLLSLSRETELPLSYVTTGQAVPDDIEPAEVARLAQLLLGTETI